ncbi:MAG: ATP-binding protein, partial [Anaerohalosphaera sp.]|nr:ATP-binding protein [Anaerohalosphaera sp.]
SRIQRGRKKYNFIVGNIDHCVSDVVEMMTPAARNAGFKLEKQLSSMNDSSQELLTAYDKDAVTQIVINLIDNAVKYAADAAEKTIIVRTSSAGRYVVIEVEDHGPGIPNRQRKKVFDTFYRIGDESTRQTTGTGLGLALVRRFAEAHNGYVEILSAKPTGTVLRIGLALTD